MHILISGANGLIGRDLAKNLSQRYKIFAIYRSKKKDIIKIKNITWIKHDLKNKFVKKLKPIPKFIIHCAVTHEFSKRRNMNDYLQSNVISLKNLIDYAQLNNVNMIINLSTISIYGTVEKNILDEKYLPKNQDLLGTTKLLAEQILKQNKINFINIRLPGILCKMNKKNIPRPWLNLVLNKIKKNQRIDIYNLRSKFNNVVDTDEIAKFIKFLIKKNIKIRDVFNFACSKPIILKKVLNIAKSQLNSKSKIIEIKNKKNNPFTISTKKLEKKLNYKTQPTDITIQKYLENFI